MQYIHTHMYVQHKSVRNREKGTMRRLVIYTPHQRNPKIFCRVLKTLPILRNQVSHSYKIISTIMLLYVLSLRSLRRRQKDEYHFGNQNN